MMRSRRAVRIGLAVLWVAGAAGLARAADDTALQPYQMVRSLQLVQDRIAAGDHAALPMQRKLLEMIDQRFRSANSGDFVDKRNYQAMLVYAMSGGNPQTIGVLLERLHLDGTDRALGTGILGYLNGDPTTARASLEGVDPLTLTPELGAFFALVKGSIAATEDPTEALRMFDEARLLNPGTLIEEAALRRSLPLEARNLDAVRFFRTSNQYVRRYLLSPYASQFVDAFVAGVVALHGKTDLSGIDDVVSVMDPERQKVIYLRLARRAAIEGMSDLTVYASAKADAVRIDGVETGSDPRALLYSSLATITSDNVDQVLPRLQGIDRSRLSESDRKLLEAAEAIAAEVTAAPPPAAEATEPKPPDERGADVAAAPDTQEGLPDAEPIDAPLAAAAAAPDAAPVMRPAATEAKPTPGAAGEPPADDPAGAVLVDARKKLDAIDKLLKDTTQ